MMPPWRGHLELDGGAFMNQASHYVDLVDWLVGRWRAYAMTATPERDIEVEDTGVLNIRWRSGARFHELHHAHLSQEPGRLHHHPWREGHCPVGGVPVNDIQIWDLKDKRDYDEDIKKANHETTSVYGFGHPLYYRNVVDTLRGDAEPAVDGREGLKSLEVLIAAYLSARGMAARSRSPRVLSEGLVDIGIAGGGSRPVLAPGHCSSRASGCAYERDQVAAATSSASSKLLHGGLRYLENRFRLVREACASGTSGSSVSPVDQSAPAGAARLFDSRRPRWMMGVGLFSTTNWRAEHPAPARWLPAEEVLRRDPAFVPKGLRADTSAPTARWTTTPFGLWVADQARQAGVEIHAACGVMTDGCRHAGRRQHPPPRPRLNICGSGPSSCLKTAASALLSARLPSAAAT